jgi:hypothetical protein
MSASMQKKHMVAIKLINALVACKQACRKSTWLQSNSSIPW